MYKVLKSYIRMYLCRNPVVEEEVRTPILILSTRRCGSALLMEMIHSQPKVIMLRNLSTYGSPIPTRGKYLVARIAKFIRLLPIGR